MQPIAITGIYPAFGELTGVETISAALYNGTVLTIDPGSENPEKRIKLAAGDTRGGVFSEGFQTAALVMVEITGIEHVASRFAEYCHEESLVSGIKRSAEILSKEDFRSVILVAPLGAFVLRRLKDVDFDGEKIYGTIENLWQVDDDVFLEAAGNDHHGLVEICCQPSVPPDSNGFAQFVKAFQNYPEKSIALGFSPDATTGLTKAVLSLYGRYLAQNPSVDPDMGGIFRETPFYTPCSSRTWFTTRKIPHRKALVAVKSDEGITIIQLSENGPLRKGHLRYLGQSVPLLFPIPGDTPEELFNGLKDLEEKMDHAGEGRETLREVAATSYRYFLENGEKAFRAVILGDTLKIIKREIKFITSGLKKAFETDLDVKTPGGSYFTPHPLKEDGKTVFVYPGVGSAYTGLGQDLFQMFPDVHDFFSGLVPDVGEFLKARDLYPPLSAMPTDDELKIMDKNLRKNIMEISQCGMSFSVIYTMIMSGAFKLFPEFAMGYSMGEASMMASQMVWKNPAQLGVKLRETDVFNGALNGKLTAVRNAWGFPETGEKKIWESYTLIEDRHIVEEAVKGEERVYITLVNTDREIVIAGYPPDCLRVIEKIGCKFFPLNLDLAIHSGPARDEYDKMLELYTLELAGKPVTKFYSSSCYLPIPVRSKSVAHSISKAFCDTVDFPRLVNKVYDDGGRIFIETGPRMICSQWIDQILSDKKHLTVPLDIKGSKNQITILRALAMLVSHKAGVDIGRLYKY